MLLANSGHGKINTEKIAMITINYDSGYLGTLENRNFDRLKLRLKRKFLYNIIANKFPYILIFLF